MKPTRRIFLLMGATGDLAVKKILPALDQWPDKEPFFDEIWCLGRRAFDTGSYLTFVEAKGAMTLGADLRSRIRYAAVEFGALEDYVRLSAIIGEKTHWDGVFYLAVKPELFVPIVSNLKASGLFNRGCEKCRLIIEKPFGEDLESARHIQAELLKLAEEEQIYRVDHYLGKDMVRNLLALRFGNRIFQESWNGNSVAAVRIVSWETAGVEERLDYYDKAGAINDMIQSHLLQILALTAMEPPSDFEPENIRKKKLELLRRLVLSADAPVRVGQYVGYRAIAPSVSQSRTETYAQVTLEIDSPRWGHTPFVLETGKKMKEKRMEISLEYRPCTLPISKDLQQSAEPNRLTIEVHPKEGVRLQFNSKAPGYDYRMEPVEAEYCHACRTTGNKPEAYVKLLMDASEGDKTLFAGWEEVELQWSIADRIRAAATHAALLSYEEGSI